MSAAPLISVVMPVRDGAPYLAAAIGSVQAQTYPRWELIVVDNGSTDASVEIVSRLADHDRRIRLITEVRGDRGRAKNAGVEHARGELIARMDADDIAVAGRLAAQLDWMQRTGAQVCGSWIVRFGDAGGLGWFPETHEAIYRELLFRSALMGPSVLLRAEILKQHPYSETATFKDYELWARLVGRYRMTNIPAVLLRYRCHARQSHVLEAEGCRADICKFGAPLFRRLFPDADRDDAQAVAKLAAKEPFTSVDELEHAGTWLVRLAQSPDPMLRRRMLERWRGSCRISANLGPSVYRSYVRLAPAFEFSDAVVDRRLLATCIMRARTNSRLDRGLKGFARASRRLRHVAA